MQKEYIATGIVLSRAGYTFPTKKYQGNTLDELKSNILIDFNNKEIAEQNSTNFKIDGGVFKITYKRIIDIDGEDFVNEKNMIDTIGDLTDTEFDGLLNKIILN